MNSEDHAYENTDTVALTEWANEPKVRELKADLLEADSAHSTQVSKIDGWLDNLYVRNAAKVNTPKGKSKVVPKLIRKQAEWRYAALSEPFLSSPDIFDVAPVSWEDKKAAQQNQIILNNQFNTRIDKVSFIDNFIRTAVNEGTVILQVGWKFEEETYEELEPIFEYELNFAYADVLDKAGALRAANPTQFMTEVPQEVQHALQMYLQTGRPYHPVKVGEEYVEKTRTVANHPTVEVCDYKNIKVDPTCKGDLSQAKFVSYSFETSLSELENDGRYSNLDKINVEANTINGDPDHESDDASNFNFSDKARKKFVMHEYWGHWDIDGTGIVKPIVASWVGDTFIRLEENPFPDKQHPFISVPYLPVKDSIYGEPDGSLLEENQQINGAVTRGMIDIMAGAANGQTGIRKDMLDVVNRRRFERGQDYEFNQHVDPRQGIHMHTYPEIPASAQFMVQLQNSEAEAMTGSRAFGATNTQGIGESATAARGVLDAASKREVGILRRLANGMVKVGRKFISMNAEFLDEEEVVRITNEKFVTVKRDDLAGNFDLKLTISTAEEDNKKAEELSFMLQTMGNNMDFNLQKMLLSDIAKLRKMPTLAKNIEDFQPQPDPLQQQKVQLELELLKAQIANEYAQTQERQAGAVLDQAKAGNVQSDTDKKDLDFIEQESGVTQERDLQKQSAQAEANIKLEAFKASLNNVNQPENVTLQ